MLAVAAASFAIRPIHKAFPYKQSDGTTVMAYKNGDGFLAFYTSIDNQVLVENADGDLCYAKMVDGKLVASDFIAHEADSRSQAETAFILANNLKPTDTAVRKLAAPRRAPRGAIGVSTSDGLGQYGTSGIGAVSSQGEVTIPVIMVEFADTKFHENTTIEKMTRFYNEEGYSEETGTVGSVKDYYVSQSRGMFTPTFDVVAKVTLSNGYAYYGANNASGNDMRVFTMIQEAVAAATAQGVDFNNYKVNNKVPLVSVLYAGQGEATSNDKNTIWPHERDLSIYNGTMSGVQFGAYFVGNELYGSRLMGMGVFVHEFCHALGLPDFYVTDYSYTNDSAFGDWSIMDSGPYVNDTYAPIGFTAYERSVLGWLDIPEITTDEAVTLINPNNDEGQLAVMIRNPNDDKEYFIFENRQPGTWYPGSFGSGMMVTRVAYNATTWASNKVNNIQNAKRAMMVTANGAKIYSASEAQLFANGIAKIEDFSLINGSKITDIPIYKIIKHNNGTVTFNFIDRTLPTEAENNGMEFEKVTDVNTLASGDSIILVSEADNVAMSNIQASTSRCVVNVTIEDDIVYGNNDVQIFSLLKTAAGKWGFRTSKGYLSIGANGALKTVNSSTNALTDIMIADGDATVTFSGNFTANIIKYNMNDYYFACYQDGETPVQIYRKKDVANGINTIVTQPENTVKGIYTITGQKVSKENMHKGIYIVDGKKVVVK